MLDTFQSPDNTTWYYNSELGLYFDNPNLVGMGYTFDELEEMVSIGEELSGWQG
jgi:hypothetical protein